MVAIDSNVVWTAPCMVVSGDRTTHVASVVQQTAIVMKAGTKNERMVVSAGLGPLGWFVAGPANDLAVGLAQLFGGL